MAESMTNTHPKAALTDPPGGVMVWMFISLELVTFGVGFIVFLVKRAAEPVAFAAAQATLHPEVALLNTILLLVSGCLVARGAQLSKAAPRIAARFMTVGALLGLAFLVVKGFEYRERIAVGRTPESGTFETFYWLLTGFHFLHVVVGVSILVVMAWTLNRGRTPSTPDFGIGTGAAFWHMCDLIWVLLFPLLYLLRW